MRRYNYIILSLLVIHLVFLGIFAALRLADADEGVYLNAARMVHLGLKPYADFFYTQLPMMPTIFSALADNGWLSFFILRGFAVLAGFLSAMLLILIVLKMTRDYLSATVAAFLYAFSGMFIVWHSTFKALPFCHFLALGTFFYWLLFHEKRSLPYLIFSGLFLSALMNFRPVFLVLLPLYLISVALLSERKKIRSLIVFIASLIPFSLPTLSTALWSGDKFIFGNLMFQLYREGNAGLLHVISNRLDVFLRAIIDPQLLLILILTLISIRFMMKQKQITSMKDLMIKPEGMALMNLVLVFAIYLLPHPMSRQYIEQYLAFGIIIIVLGLRHIVLVIENALRPLYRRAVIAGMAVLYLMALIPYMVIFLGAARTEDRRFAISEIKKVTDKMLESGMVSDTVLSEWPGYAFLTRQMPLRYTEIIGSEFQLPCGHEDYMNYKLCDRIYLREQIAGKIPKLVVTVYKAPEYYANILEDKYDKAFQSDVVSIYRRR